MTDRSRSSLQTWVAAFVVLWCLLAPTAAAQSTARVDTISFTTREGTSLAFDVSPDGTTIVFDLMDQLWLLPVAGGRAKQLTDAVVDSANHFDPSFAADGRSIIFQSDRLAGGQLWRVDVTTGAITKLLPAADDAEQRAPSIAPDGRRLAFIQRDTIRLLDLGDGSVRHLTAEGLPAQLGAALSWSGDGSRLVLTAGPAGAAGTRIWEIVVDSGVAQPFASDSIVGGAPALSPDGVVLAYWVRERDRAAHVWIRQHGAPPKKLTAQRDLSRRRLRWIPGSRELIYSAEGRLWRISVDSGGPREIPFEADIRFVRRRAEPRAVTFPEAGASTPARGFAGLALSPDAAHVAIIALNRLWVMPVDGAPRVVRELPWTANGLAWSPDGSRVVWGAGAGGAEDLFITTVATGETRQLTRLPGREERPSWSPDGKHIAFVHWTPQTDTRMPWEDPIAGWFVRIRTVPADATMFDQLDLTHDFGAPATFNWAFPSITGLGQQAPIWIPDGSGVLSFTGSSRATVLSFTGDSAAITGMPTGASFISLTADSSLIFVRGNQLWRARFVPGSGVFRDTTRLAADAALHASAARDGSVLYISSDGLRLRSTDGSVRRIGWPISFTGVAPAPLLIRSGLLIDGSGDTPRAADILSESGRIVRIAPPGTIAAEGSFRVIDAGGRFVMPGLIDAHAHLWDDGIIPSLLYYGVTTIRDMGSATARSAAFRDAIDAGLTPGPRVVLGGFHFNPNSGPYSATTGNIQLLGSPGDAERGLAIAEALGASYAKMRAPATVRVATQLVALALRRGFRISGHCGFELPLVAAGLEGKDHLGPSCNPRHAENLYDDIVQLARATNMWVVPTIGAYSADSLVATDTTIISGNSDGVPATPWIRWWSLRNALPRTTPTFSADAARAAAAMHLGGVALGAGADLAAPGWALHRELELMVKSGMSPLQAIVAATQVNARVLGVEQEIGMLAPGRRADMVILDADPLADISNTRKIWKIIQNGTEVDREGLRSDRYP